MRIAILTSARTGSTSLYYLIRSHLVKKRYKCYSEPFNKYLGDKLNIQTYDVDHFDGIQDVFIKTFVSVTQKPKSFLGNEEGYWNWFFEYFEKVILLDRMDKDLQSESLTYHIKKDDIISWQKKQIYDLSITTSQEIEHSKKVLLNESTLLHEFSKKGFPLYYFEDIFIEKDRTKINNIFEYLGIDLLESLYYDYIYSDARKIRMTTEDTRHRKLI
jgi:hypothetical protein